MQIIVKFNDDDIGINKLISLNSKNEQSKYNELINEISEYKSNNVNMNTAINKLYARYYCSACDKAFGKRCINTWNMKMRILKQMYGKLIKFD